MISRRQLLHAAGAFALLSTLPLARLRAATAPRAAALNDQQRAEAQQVQDYLNGIHTLSSRFTQVTADGGTARGQLYLSRPGRMRFEYDPPVPVLLVADGRTIYYYDKELQQVSELRVNDTPAGFLLRDRITLSGDVTLTSFEHKPGAIRLGLIETKEPGQGSVVIVLDDKPLLLKQWTVTDPQRKQVTVSLDNPRFGVQLDPKLFYWTDPRPSNQGR